MTDQVKYKKELFLSHWFQDENEVADILWGKAAIWVMMDCLEDPVAFHNSSDAFAFIRYNLNLMD